MMRFTGRALGLLAAACFAAAGCAKCESQGDVESEETSAKATTGGPVRFELSTSAKEYVQGQPIRLTLVMTSQRETPYRFERIGFAGGPPPRLFLSTDGKAFSECEVEPPQIVAKMGREADTLKPGASTTYRFRALYGWRSTNALALIQPGRVWLQVRPFLTEVSDGKAFQRLSSFDVHSNAVAVRIREATGDDAVVWSVLREDRLLRFVQFGHAPDVGTIREVFRLARAHPKSSYFADLESSLNEFCSRQSGNWVGIPPEWRLLVADLRNWPRIPNPEELPFPEDSRLGVKFTYTVEDSVLWPEACKEVSRLTSIPLSVSPEFADRVIYRGWREGELRGMMRYLAGSLGEWVRDGDGYKLVPKPLQKAKPAEGSP